MSTTATKFRDLFARAQACRQGALTSMSKSAADEEALTGIKDPTNEGTVSIPSGDGDKASNRDLPTNGSNEPDGGDKMHHIMDVTKPNGVGQGSYVTPRNGTAIDEAVNSPTKSLDKIAQLAGALQSSEQQAPVEESAEKPAEKQATADVNMPESLEYDILTKLASIGAYMLGSERGRQAVEQTIAHEAGIKEAAAIVNAAGDMMKQAAAHATAQQKEAEAALMIKAAAAETAHTAWLNSFKTDMEKQAYMAGAQDGAAMADAEAAGVSPEAIDAASAEGMSDEEIMAMLQEAVAQGLISEEEVEAILAQAAQGDTDQNEMIGPDEFAAILQAALQSGEITEDQASQAAQMYLAQVEGMAGGAEGAVAPEAAEAVTPEDAALAEEAVKTAAAHSTQNVANIVNYLSGAK